MRKAILLVEDERTVAEMLLVAMRRWGHEALYAGRADEALALAHAHRAEIAMVICDVVLPDMPGPELAAMIRAMCPGVQTCFMSGYPPVNLSDRGLLTPEDLQDPSVAYLQKPFMPQDLRELIASSLSDSEPLPQYTVGRAPLYVAAACV